MKRAELEKLLREARPPERDPGYWEQFPGRVAAEIRKRGLRSGGGTPSREIDLGASPIWREWLAALYSRPLALAGTATVCLALMIGLGIWAGRHDSSRDTQYSAAQRYFREIAGLFPHQLQAIVFDEAGAHLVLADRAEVPDSAPLYLKICDAAACHRFVTFSGQKIRVNGEDFEVLVDRQGDVMVVGEQLVWSSSGTSGKSGRYRIEARPLPTPS